MKILKILYKTLERSFIFLSLFLNLISFALFWMLFKIGDEKHSIENSKEYYLKNLQCAKLENVVDSISYAGQLGRLDKITLVLTVFGIVLGFVSIFGFIAIKENSEDIARNIAETWIRQNAGPTTEKIINEILQGNKTIQEAQKEARGIRNDEEYNNL